MKELEQKIREILDPYGRHDLDSSFPHKIAQIHQAYQEAGYRNTSHYEEVNIAIDSNGHAYPAMKRRPNMMTGEEWYDRFRAEIPSQLNYDSQPRAIIEEYLESARIAAGLNDKEDI